MTQKKPSTRPNHPLVDDAKDQLAKGKMSRREFVRITALLGVAAPIAYKMSGLKPAFAEVTNSPFPADDPNATSGGTIRVAMQIQKMEDPATFSWVEMSNQARHIVEYLTMTGPDNVTRPMLAESWSPNDDLTEWTFKLREGVMFHNGAELTADIVKWNFERWMDPDTAAGGIVGLSTVSAMMEDKGDTRVMREGSVEVVDTYTIKLNLSKPVLSVPEDLYNYPTAILHPTFKPPFADNAVGTGPFSLAELQVGDRCILKRVTETTDGKEFKYWGGNVFLDEIQYFNFDEDNQLPAFAGGDVDTIYEFAIEQIELAKALPGTIIAAQTAQTLCCRFQTQVAPFDDKRVRQAIVKAIDNAAVKALVYPEGGDVAQNHHVAPVHPEYFPLPTLERDIEGAKALLKEAGYDDSNPLKFTIDVGNTDGPWHQTVCEAMRDQLRDAGIDMSINVMPPSKYWEVWDKTPCGATAWTHRPLGTMVLSLGYRSGVPWNETQYNNPEFDAALDDAEATFDVEERRAKMEKTQKIIQDDAVMVQPLFRPVYTIINDKVKSFAAHPTQYHQFNKVWIS